MIMGVRYAVRALHKINTIVEPCNGSCNHSYVHLSKFLATAYHQMIFISPLEFLTDVIKIKFRFKSFQKKKIKQVHAFHFVSNFFFGWQFINVIDPRKQTLPYSYVYDYISFLPYDAWKGCISTPF